MIRTVTKILTLSLVIVHFCAPLHLHAKAMAHDTMGMTYEHENTSQTKCCNEAEPHWTWTNINIQKEKVDPIQNSTYQTSLRRWDFPDRTQKPFLVERHKAASPKRIVGIVVKQE